MSSGQISNPDALRVAVVGAGGCGEQHARIFSRRADTNLVAVVGRTRDKTAARAEAYGSTGYTDIDEMLDVEHPDLVTVCLPNEDHFEATKDGDALPARRMISLDGTRHVEPGVLHPRRRRILAYSSDQEKVGCRYAVARQVEAELSRTTTL